MSEPAKTSERDEKMRVKLYMLNAGRAWDDQGTGYVSSTFSEKTKNMFLIVKEENKSRLSDEWDLFIFIHIEYFFRHSIVRIQNPVNNSISKTTGL